jgi:molybdopterin converting factor small subunit
MIKVMLFGSFSTIAGCREISVEPGEKTRTLADIVALVETDYLKKKAGTYMLALNGSQAKPSTAVKDNDEVAIMPPFSGG